MSADKFIMYTSLIVLLVCTIILLAVFIRRPGDIDEEDGTDKSGHIDENGPTGRNRP